MNRIKHQKGSGVLEALVSGTVFLIVTVSLYQVIAQNSRIQKAVNTRFQFDQIDQFVQTVIERNAGRYVRQAADNETGFSCTNPPNDRMSFPEISSTLQLRLELLQTPTPISDPNDPNYYRFPYFFFSGLHTDPAFGSSVFASAESRCMNQTPIDSYPSAALTDKLYFCLSLTRDGFPQNGVILFSDYNLIEVKYELRELRDRTTKVCTNFTGPSRAAYVLYTVYWRDNSATDDTQRYRRYTGSFYAKIPPP